MGERSRFIDEEIMEDAVLQYGPDDITGEEATLEWETRSPGEPPVCPRGHGPMIKQQATHTMPGGKFTVTYSVYVCPGCNETFLDREQARRYGAIQLLEFLDDLAAEEIVKYLAQEG